MKEVPEEGVEADKCHTNIHLACVLFFVFWPGVRSHIHHSG